MIATPTNEKKQKLQTFALNLFTISKSIIRHLGEIIGTMISCMAAAILGLLFY